jgi:hypothetical protein
MSTALPPENPILTVKQMELLRPLAEHLCAACLGHDARIKMDYAYKTYVADRTESIDLVYYIMAECYWKRHSQGSQGGRALVLGS